MTTFRYADPEIGCLADIINLDRYPLPLRGAGSSPEYEEFVSQAREQLDDDGLLQLPGFLQADALATMQAELRPLTASAEMRADLVSVYARDRLAEDRDDPRSRSHPRRAANVTRDSFGPQTAAHRMYVSPAIKRLVADCVRAPRVFEFADPLAGLIATVLPSTGVLPWHYDSNDFAVTLMVDAPEHGGRFEYVHNLRKPGDENLAGLAELLTDANHPSIRRPIIKPGDLQIFKGRLSLHRVTEVREGQPRIVVVFGYAERAGVIGPVDRTRIVYGRITEAHLLAEQGLVPSADAADGLIR